MGKETYYFSHDSNAITDTKILNMRCDYGLEGYGLYWAIVEMMRNEADYKLELNKNTYRAIKTLTNTTVDIEKYIKDCIDDYKLFKQEEDKFYSNSLLNRMLEYEKKRKVNQENGKLGGRPKNQKKPNGFENETEKNQNKIKENKGKENKGNKNNNNKADDSCVDGLQDASDSCIDGLQEIIEFYNNNIGTLTSYGVEVLEDYLKELDKDLIIYAMQISVEANKRTIQYIKAILNNWHKAGIRTLVEAKQESNRKKDNRKETFEQRHYNKEDFEQYYANSQGG